MEEYRSFESEKFVIGAIWSFRLNDQYLEYHLIVNKIEHDDFNKKSYTLLNLISGTIRQRPWDWIADLYEFVYCLCGNP